MSEPVDQAAAALAEQRQQIAHEGVPYMPSWAELSPEEQGQAVREAGHWLTAAERAGLLRTVPEPNADAVLTVAQALRDAGFVDPDDDTMPVFKDAYSAESRIDHWTPVKSVALAVVAALQQPDGILAGVQDVTFTPEEREELEARFKAARHERPTVLGVLKPAVTRAQVRAAATALFEWNNEIVGDPRFTLHHVAGAVDREPYGALVDEVLHHLGIHVQERDGS